MTGAWAGDSWGLPSGLLEPEGAAPFGAETGALSDGLETSDGANAGANTGLSFGWPFAVGEDPLGGSTGALSIVGTSLSEGEGAIGALGEPPLEEGEDPELGGSGLPPVGTDTGVVIGPPTSMVGTDPKVGADGLPPSTGDEFGLSPSMVGSLTGEPSEGIPSIVGVDPLVGVAGPVSPDVGVDTGDGFGLVGADTLGLLSDGTLSLLGASRGELAVVGAASLGLASSIIVGLDALGALAGLASDGAVALGILPSTVGADSLGALTGELSGGDPTEVGVDPLGVGATGTCVRPREVG